VTTAVKQPPHHNTITCYTKYGCRLTECVDRMRAWERGRAAAIRAGTWQPLIDATPVREHLTQLTAAGVTIDAIACALGVPRQSVSDFTHRHLNSRRGLRSRTDPEFAARILALTPADINAGRCDATGSLRRIQALVAAGWPLVRIGTQFGMHKDRPEQILRERRIYAATRQQISDGYQRLHRLRPERHGVAKDRARLARERAASKRWPTPAYWASRMDVIDDPHFEPMYGLTKREIVAQDASEVMRLSGLDRAAAAERLGVSKAYIDHAFREYPQYAIEVAA